MLLTSKTSSKPPADYVWIDEQTQPLPRSVRRFLHGWERAEELAHSRWEADVVIFEVRILVHIKTKKEHTLITN